MIPVIAAIFIATTIVAASIWDHAFMRLSFKVRLAVVLAWVATAATLVVLGHL